MGCKDETALSDTVLISVNVTATCYFLGQSQFQVVKMMMANIHTAQYMPVLNTGPTHSILITNLIQWLLLFLFYR